MQVGAGSKAEMEVKGNRGLGRLAVLNLIDTRDIEPLRVF